ncbi:MAG TPA: hypothetical protein VGK43_07880 [Solirubrobacterales bacterium]
MFLAAALSVGAMLALGSGTAMANLPMEAYNSDLGGVECGELTVEGNNVSGGCLSDGWSGHWVLYMSGSAVTTGCKNYFSTRTATDGSFYAVNPTIAGCSGVQRIACPGVPWPGNFELAEVGELQAEIKMCVTSPSYPTQQNWFTIDYSVNTHKDEGLYPGLMSGKAPIYGGLAEVYSEASPGGDPGFRVWEL